MSKTEQISVYVILGLIIAVLTAVSVWAIRRGNTAEENLLAVQDSLHTMELKNGTLVTYTQAMVTTNSQLGKVIQDQDGHIKELEKKIGKLQSYTMIQTVYEIDSVVMYDTVVIVDGRRCVGFGYKDEWLLFEGLNCDSTITLDKLRLSTPLEVGVTQNNVVTVTSPCPYLKVTDIKATVKEQKKPIWNVGFQVGFGGSYDLLHKTFGVGPYLGVGLSCGFDF